MRKKIEKEHSRFASNGPSIKRKHCHRGWHRIGESRVVELCKCLSLFYHKLISIICSILSIHLQPMSSGEHLNAVYDGISLGTISSDVIRRIIVVGSESIDAMRHVSSISGQHSFINIAVIASNFGIQISPRWNSLALNHLNDCKRLPAIDYLKCRSKNVTLLKIPKGHARIIAKISRQDLEEFEKTENANWTFYLLIPEGFNEFFGVTGWDIFRCNHSNSECLVHYCPNNVDRTFCRANVHNLAVTTCLVYSQNEGKAKLIKKIAQLISRCSRIAKFDIQNQSDDLEVISDALGAVQVDQFLATVPMYLFDKQRSVCSISFLIKIPFYY